MKRHTYTALFTHIVFSTHLRRPLIVRDARPRLHQCLRGIIVDAQAVPIAIGGYKDHVHLLVETKPEVAIADVVRIVKSNSSGWFRNTVNRHFAWQRGYSAFSVSRSNVDAVAAYVLRQEEHHRKRTFAEEVLLLFARHRLSP